MSAHSVNCLIRTGMKTLYRSAMKKTENTFLPNGALTVVQRWMEKQTVPTRKHVFYFDIYRENGSFKTKEGAQK